MSDPTLHTLRLHGLLKADETAIRVFLAQHALQQENSLWRLSDKASADLCIRSGSVEAPLLKPRREGPVIWLLEPGQTAPKGDLPVLTSPVQRDDFLHVLELVTQRLQAGTWDDEEEDDDDDPSGFAQTQVMAPREADRPATASPAETFHPSPPPTPQFDVRGTLRLRQWPSAEFLAQHRYYPRLASFLSNRWVSLRELQQLSNVELNDCVLFLNSALAQQLLDIRLPEALRAAASAAAASAAGPATLPPPLGGPSTLPPPVNSQAGEGAHPVSGTQGARSGLLSRLFGLFR